MHIRVALGLVEGHGAAMADDENAGEKEDEGHEAVAAHDLAEGKQVHSLVTPVAGLVQQLAEVGLPDGQHPVVAQDEPDEEEQAEDGLTEP